MLKRFAILGLLAATATIGQDRRADMAVETKPGNCEMNAALLDSVRNDALKESNRDGAVILVARLGKGETARMHNRRRLLVTKEYLIKHGLPAPRIVVAEGERAEGYGRVEMYVGGKLHVLLLSSRNKPMCVECCEPDDSDFYPYRGNKKRGR